MNTLTDEQREQYIKHMKMDCNERLCIFCTGEIEKPTSSDRYITHDIDKITPENIEYLTTLHKDGDLIPIPDGLYILICCDCQLTHEIQVTGIFDEHEDFGDFCLRVKRRDDLTDAMRDKYKQDKITKDSDLVESKKYTVFKITDIDKYLDITEKLTLTAIESKIIKGQIQDEEMLYSEESLL